jgi:DNA-binding GntR family transcriptional regulator
MAPITLSQSISQTLANDVVAGRLASGTRLDEQSIAKRFKVSRSPVRDALRQLVATQLVEYLPRRGFSVASINTEKLRDLYEGLSEVEALCARLFAMRAGSTDLAALELIHDAAKDAARRNDAIAYAAVNEDFHRAIYAGSRNDTLREMALEIRQRLAPFRSRLFFPRDRVESSLREHDAIVKALMSRDDEKAAEAVRRHTSRTAINVMNHLSTEDERPEMQRRAGRNAKRRASKPRRKARS